jgi:hypothetical protein
MLHLYVKFFLHSILEVKDAKEGGNCQDPVKCPSVLSRIKLLDTGSEGSP